MSDEIVSVSLKNFEIDNTLISGSDSDDYIQNFGARVTIRTGNGNDYIDNNNWHTDSVINQAASYSYTDAGNGNDTIYNFGAPYITLNGDNGNDYIYSAGIRSSINGGLGNDTLINERLSDLNVSSEYSYIDGGLGNDSITNWYGANSSIDGGLGDDTIGNTSAHTTILGGLGNDIIWNAWGYFDGVLFTTSDYSYIDGGLGNDSLANRSSGVTFNGGLGNDTITLDSDSNDALIIYSEGDGNDVIQGFKSGDSISIASGSYSTAQSDSDVIIAVGNGRITVKDFSGSPNIIGNESVDTASVDTVVSNTASNTLISGTDSADSISNMGGSNVTINGGGGADTIDSWGSNVNIHGGADHDSIYVYNNATAHTVNGGYGNDTIQDAGASDKIFGESGTDYIYLFTNASDITVDGGGDNDSIYSGAQNSSLFAGLGDDYIHLYTQGTNNTVRGDWGNDTLQNYAPSFVYQIGSSDGSDVILGATSSSTIVITDGTYSTSSDGNDTIIKVGAAQLTLKDFTDSIVIQGEQERDTVFNNTASNTLISGTDNADSISNMGGSNVTINGGGGSDTIDSWGSNVNIHGGADHDSIYVYNVNDSATTHTVNGGYGNDTIQDAGASDKIFGESGADYIYLFTNASDITVDGGGDNDSIFSGAQNSSLFAGIGDDYIHLYTQGTNNTVRGDWGNDTLQNYAPSFVYQIGTSDGSDVILGATASSTIVITDGTYSTSSDGNDTIIKVGAAQLTLKDFTDSIVIQGEQERDTVFSNTASNTLISGTDSADSIYNDGGSNITLNGNAGDDTIQNDFAEYILINGGADHDSIYGNNNYATINGDGGNDSIVGNHWRSNINGGAGSDLISLTTYWYDTIDGGEGNDSIIAGGSEHSINGGAGDDVISLDGGALTVRGGAGNDTIYGVSGKTHLYQYSSGDGDDVIYGADEGDTVTLGGASYTASTVGNSVILNITGGGSVTLDSAAGKNININGIVETPVDTYSPQDVIKTFMKSLDDARSQSSTAMLNDAIYAASKGQYSSIQTVIDKMIDDCNSYNALGSDGWRRFLLEKCDIDLNNDDTGAITGWDAGGSSVKTAESIVPEYGSRQNYSGSGFNVNGLNFYTPGNYNSAQQIMVDGLYSWWLQQSLDLLEESYGSNFGFSSESSATVKDMTLIFQNENNGWLAWVTHWYGGNGDATRLTLTINMRYYSNLTDEINGKSADDSAGYLDRTLSHEFTHAIMAANINNFNALPMFISEGMAELTHGIDDFREYDIRSYARDTNTLRNALSLTSTSNNYAAYAGGYMFLRYIAKQFSSTADSKGFDAGAYSYSADSTIIPQGISIDGTGLIVSTDFENKVVDLTDYDSSVTKIDATALESDINIFGNGSGNSLSGGAGKDQIYGSSGNDTLNGGAGKDTLFGGSDDDVINGDADDDILYGDVGNDTLTGGAGADVFVYDNGNDVITDYAVGEDKIRFEVGLIEDATFDGADVLLHTDGGVLTVRNGKGADITFVDEYDRATVKSYGTVYEDLSTGVSINKSKTKIKIQSPFEGTIDAAEISEKLKTIDASKTSGAVNLIGNDNKNVLKAGTGGSSLDGGGGADKLYGGSGADVFIYDGQGKDKIYNYGAGDRIVIDALISKVKVSGKNVVFTVDKKNTLTVQKVVGSEVTITDVDGQTNTYVFKKKDKSLEDALIGSAQMPADDYWFINDDAVGESQLDSIVDASIDDNALGNLTLDTRKNKFDLTGEINCTNIADRKR